MKTKVLKVNPLKPEEEIIRVAADVIRSGGLVAFPTETVYGLGANALNPAAVKGIFKAKNRPSDNPLIVHISRVAELGKIASDVPDQVARIAKRVWPGPITFLLHKSKNVPQEVCGRTTKVAVRIPAHPVALALIEKARVPIAAPSANASTRPSPTNAKHVVSDLRGRIDLVLDGGNTFFGVESTIIDTTLRPYTLLRPGAYDLEELRRRFGRVRLPRSVKQAAESRVAFVPGMKYRHYAPTKPLYMASREAIVKNPDLIHDSRVGLICSREVNQQFDSSNGATKNVIVLGSEKNLYEVAKNLFDSFRRLDSLAVEFGIIQTFEERGIGLAIMNRIKKATSHKIYGSLVK